MIETKLQTTTDGWLWQDMVSSYSFWGLVIAAFLMAVSLSFTSFSAMTILMAENLDGRSVARVSVIGIYIAALAVLYFLRERIKLALVLFTLISVMSLCLTYFGSPTNLPIKLLASACSTIGRYGFVLSIAAGLVTARLPLKSFMIVLVVIGFWWWVGLMVGSRLELWHLPNLNYALNNGVVTLPERLSFNIRASLLVPSILAALAVLFLPRSMFFDRPETKAKAKPPQRREPVWVFVASLIVPFYFLVWLYNRPGELKSLAPDMHQPSPVGAVCLGLFAPMILPFWFHNVRKDFGKRLESRSPSAIGVAGFLMPPIAAGMAQSDINQLVSENT